MKAFQDYYPEDTSYCYGCGRLNEKGLQIKSYWDGERSVARFVPRPEHMAVPGYVYGGLLASLVDCHGTGTAAAATAYFKSGTLAALNLEGKVRWQPNLVEAFGRDTLFWDHGTSPVLTDKHVIMARMHHGESWLAAFDKSTGAMNWKEARNYETPVENDNSYATPLVLRHDNKESLLVWGGEHLTLHDASNGKLFWSANGFNPSGGQNWPVVASSVVVGDVALVAHGRSDRGNGLLYGVNIGGAGGTNHIWSRTDTGTFVPTPAVWRGNVYLLRDRGEVECLDPPHGEDHLERRISENKRELLRLATHRGWKALRHTGGRRRFCGGGGRAI